MPVSLFQYMIGEKNAIRELQPSPEVQDVIAGFYIVPAQRASLAFNDGMPAIAFTAGEVEVITAKGSYTIASAWLSSQYLENIRLSHHELLVVRFYPVPFYRLFRLSPAALRSRSAWDLPAALGEQGEKLLAEHTIADIEALVLQLKGDNNYSNALLQQTLSRIQQEKGNITVREISKAMRVSYKWLERNFANHVGISPKEYARLQRFLYAYGHMVAQEGQDLSRIAIHHGYYDQNHFTKEFRKFTGRSPLAYLRGCSL